MAGFEVTPEAVEAPVMRAVPFEGEMLMVFSSFHAASGCLRDERALCQSLTERKVLARGLGELDHEIIRRYSCPSDDPRIQLFEQSEAGFPLPAANKSDLSDNPLVGITYTPKTP